MKLKTSKIIALAITLIVVFSQFLFLVPARAAYRIPGEVEYKALIDDSADVLSDEEEAAIRDELKQFYDQCNIAVVTASGNGMVSAKSYYSKYIDDEDGGVLLYIDTNTKQGIVYSESITHHILNDSREIEITDNITHYVAEGEYVECVNEGLREIYSVLAGETLFAPMRYINSAFIALALASVIMFLFVHHSRDDVSDISNKKEIKKYMLQTSKIDFPNPNVIETSRYTNNRYYG